MAKAFVIAAGIIKVMGSQHLKYSQQLEDLEYTSGYGLYTFIKGESEHVPFFLLFTLVRVFQSIAGLFNLFIFN